MAACMEAGIALVFTDERHTPSGLALPFHRHHRQGAVAKLQIEAKDGVKKRLWQTHRAREDLQSGGGTGDTQPRRRGNAAGKSPAMWSRTIPTMWRRAQRAFYWGRLFEDFIRDDADDRRNKI